MKLDLSKYFFIAFFIAVLYISYLTLMPFMVSIVSAFVIAFIFYPLYKILYKKTNMQNLSAFIISFLMILIITIPSFFIINTITKEASNVYSEVTIKLTQDEHLFQVECSKQGTLCNAINAINENPRIRFYISGAITTFASGVTRSSSEFLFSVPKKILNLLIIFLLVFFLLKSGKHVWELSKDILPLKESHKVKILKKFTGTVNGVVYGYLIIALIEALIGWVAFAIIGNNMALIFGVLFGILALIPMVGAPLIWIPTVMIYFLSGSPYKATIILIAGIIIIMLDLFVRNMIIGDKTSIHPSVVALGVLGGLTAFGPVGIVIGPLILSVLLTTIEIYREEKKFFIYD